MKQTLVPLITHTVDRPYGCDTTTVASDPIGAGATVSITDAPSALAEKRKMLAAQIADIEAKLAAGKEPEFRRIAADVESANRIFSTSWALVDTALINQSAKKSVRKCSACAEVGHNKKNCPKLR
jgi:hypothetical protein